MVSYMSLVVLHNYVFISCVGITIVHDLFKVGESATARCISDTPATRIEWLNEEDEVVLSATSTEQLDLVFSLVNDSIHDRNYVCNVTRVTRDGGMIGTQNFTVDVIGKIYSRVYFRGGARGCFCPPLGSVCPP